MPRDESVHNTANGRGAARSQLPMTGRQTHLGAKGNGLTLNVSAHAMDGSPPSEPNYRVAAVENAVSLLEAFSFEFPQLTLRELSERSGFSVSSVYRMTASLLRLRMLVRTNDGLYRLGPAMLRFGKIYEASFDLAQVVRPVLARVVAETKQTGVFYIREGDVRVCLCRHNAPGAFVHNVNEGAELPLDKGAPGRILLAFSGEPGAIYDQIRGNGYVVSIGERDLNGAAAAAPVFGADGQLVGALGISGLRTDLEQIVHTTIKDTAVAAAADLTAALSGRRPLPAARRARRGRPPKARSAD